MIDRGIPRKDYEIHDEEGNQIGIVTSGTMSPSMKKGIGLGYVNLPHNQLNSNIFISVRNKNLKALVVKAPFYKK
jgi:aminomethyltransferase